MDLRDSPAEASFRAQLRGWLARQLPADWAGRPPRPGRWDPGIAREFTSALHAGGYAGLTWPVEYGGRGLPLGFQAIYLEEAILAGAPEHLGILGLNVVGPTILAHGTREQKQHYLPRILAGEILFCLGFSEAEAGSDLAAVRTAAVPHDGGFLVTGQKLWSSYAHLAGECLLLARTATAGPPHQGLTCLLVDMAAPGVTVHPLRQITGESEFSRIELADVWIPAGRVLGSVGDGWRIVMTGLANERGTLGCTLTARLAVQLSRLITTARALGRAGDPVVRDRIAALAVTVSGLRWASYRALSAAGGTPGPESSIIKLAWSEAHQGLTALALDLLGADAALGGDGGFWGGYWQYHQLRSLGNTIEGGTSEIQRNVIAERLLGLPRSR